MLSSTKNKQTPKRNSVKMNTTLIEKENQMVNPDKISILKDYFSAFKIGTLLNKTEITKTKGVSPLTIFTIVFNLAFIRKNLYQGIVKNKNVSIDKNAVYNFLN